MRYLIVFSDFQDKQVNYLTGDDYEAYLDGPLKCTALKNQAFID